VETKRKRLILILISLIATTVIMRTILYFYPDTDLIIGGFEMHHLFVGIIILALSAPPLITLGDCCKWMDIAALSFGAGMGLVLDELVLLIVTDGSNAAYYLPGSYIGAIVSIVLFSIYILFLMRKAESNNAQNLKNFVRYGKLSNLPYNKKRNEQQYSDGQQERSD